MSVTERCTVLLVTAIIVGVTFTDTVEGVCGNSSLVAGDVEQFITSPDYPNLYSNNMRCQWDITANSLSDGITLTVRDFVMDESPPSCPYDYVEVYDGSSTNSPITQRWCGSVQQGAQISTGHNITMVFYSNHDYGYKRFKIGYTSRHNSDVCTNVALLANETGQYITSPAYPNYYLSLPACHWIISADSSSRVVVLKLLDFGLGNSASCGTDYVEVYDGLCGNTTLLAYDVEQYITSPYYPNNYPSDTDCLWRISADASSRAVVLQLLDFNLDGYIPNCDSDSVTIYDGNRTSSPRLQVFCGQVSEARLASTGPFMIVAFHSDWLLSYSGFKLAYTSSEKSDLCRNVTLTATANVNYITSPDYPDNYQSNVSCQWSISAKSSSSVVVLKFLDFFLEGTSPSCSTDYVEIYDGASSNSSRIQLLCGQVPNTQFTSSGPSLFVAFHSDLSSNFKGFKLEYTSQERAALCSNVPLLATEHVNYITSPNYPNVYPSNASCQWRISADVSRVVVLKLVDFYLDGTSPTCDFDNVTIYDGYSPSSPRVELLCGQLSSVQVTSTGPFMTVAFQSDGSTNYRGFKFVYTSQQSDLCSNATLSATETVHYITSPGYPDNYPSNGDCQWIISADSPSRVVVMKLLDLELEESTAECTFDFVAVYDGPNTSSPREELLCGQASGTQLTSSGPSMTVTFHSDGSNNFRGFKLEYNSQEQSDLCSNVYLNATETGQFITSPHYPNDYPSNRGCVWRISAETPSRVVVLKVLDFELEGHAPFCGLDNVQLFYGSSISSPRAHLLCGQLASTQFASTGPLLTVIFQSDGRNNFRGFKFEYTSKESGLCANASLVATGIADFITSPRYPNDYPSTMSCQWSISADSPTRVVVLDVLDFVLEGSPSTCSFDYVAIYDGNSTLSPIAQLLCGHISSQQVISTGPFLTVVFHSDDTSNFRGFKLEYSSEESALCADVDLFAKQASQFITSPGYPNNYPSDMGCQWIISANSSSSLVVLSVEDFELEGSPPTCTFDYLAIYNGPSASSPRIQLLCGHQESATQFTSTGPSMTVVFRSDGAINFKGFRLGYTSQ